MSTSQQNCADVSTNKDALENDSLVEETIANGISVQESFIEPASDKESSAADLSAGDTLAEPASTKTTIANEFSADETVDKLRADDKIMANDSSVDENHCVNDENDLFSTTVDGEKLVDPPTGQEIVTKIENGLNEYTAKKVSLNRLRFFHILVTYRMKS